MLTPEELKTIRRVPLEVDVEKLLNHIEEQAADLKKIFHDGINTFVCDPSDSGFEGCLVCGELMHNDYRIDHADDCLAIKYGGKDEVE